MNTSGRRGRVVDPAEQHDLPRPGSPRLILVDDHPMLRAMLRIALRLVGGGRAPLGLFDTRKGGSSLGGAWPA